MRVTGPVNRAAPHLGLTLSRALRAQCAQNVVVLAAWSVGGLALASWLPRWE